MCNFLVSFFPIPASTLMRQSLLSVIPEVHVVFPKGRSGGGVSTFSSRTDNKGKEFVTISDDTPRLEWRISKSHRDILSVSGILARWIQNERLNIAILLSTDDSQGELLSGAHLELFDAVCSSFVIPSNGTRVCACAWSITSAGLDDLLTSGFVVSDSFGEGEVVPETTSVKLDSVVEYQKFLRRIQTSVSSDPHTVLFVRFAVFTETTGEVFLVHVVLTKLNRNFLESISVIPSVRNAKKTGCALPSNLSLAQACLLPLMTGNSKPFIILPLVNQALSDSSAVLYQSIFDACEKICLVSLPCAREERAQLQDFDTVERVDLLEKRRPAERRSVVVEDLTPMSPEKSPPNPDPLEEVIRHDLDRLDSELGRIARPDDSSLVEMYETELSEVKSKNLLLRNELDKMRLGGSSGFGTGNAYTSHLVNEVKGLRAELVALEAEKRKYLTSKRLVESLVEKTNKMKVDLSGKASKIKEMEAVGKSVKLELAELRSNCEKLLVDNAALLEHSQKAPPDPTLQFRSVYKEFLFPFDGKKDLERYLVRLNEALQKLERTVAVACPSAVMEVRRSLETLEKVRVNVNTLISACERLEVSAGCILSNDKKGSKKNFIV